MLKIFLYYHFNLILKIIQIEKLIYWSNIQVENRVAKENKFLSTPNIYFLPFTFEYICLIDFILLPHFFQAAVVSILLYDGTGEKARRQLHKNAASNIEQQPTKHQLYGHLPPITKTIQVRRTRHAGHYWGSRNELISDVLLWTPHMAEQKQDGQLEYTYRSYDR